MSKGEDGGERLAAVPLPPETVGRDLYLGLGGLIADSLDGGSSDAAA